MITLNNINLSSIDLSGIDLRGIKLGLGGRGGGSGDGFPQLPGDVTRWHFGGLTNEMMAAMDDPRIEDADGKGRFLSFKNFAWGGMSGVGGYGDENHLTFYKFTFDDYVFIAIKAGVKHMNFTFRVTGLQPGNKLTLAFLGTTNTVYGTWDKDGIYTVNSAVVEVGKPVYFYNGYGATRGEFTIEILPLYPGALVFDGVDDWAGCDNLPLLPKEKGYSIIALRNWITRYDATQYKRPLISNLDTNDEGAFLIEYRKDENVNDVTGSYNSFTDVYIDDNNPITWQTSSSYNGQIIKKGTSKPTNKLCICKTYFGQLSNYANAAIWEIVILDHDATEEELTKIKDYFVKTYPWLFPDQAWTVTGKTNEDEDRATIANITGNGNNLVLSNFGFAGNSGYGEYAQNFNHYGFGNLKTITYTRTAASMQLDVPAGSLENIYSNADGEAPIGFVYNFNLNITGLKTGNLLSISQGSTLDNIIANINKDGVYNIKATVDDSWNQRRIYFWIRNSNGPETTLSIEQIPDYEGYLVTDGVDDKITPSAFTLGKKFTVVGENKILSNTYANAGLVKASSFFVFPNSIGVTCYINRQSKGLAIPSKRLKSICSDGRIYYDDWAEAIDVGGNMESNNPTPLFWGYQKNEFTRFAFKNLAIYNNKTLSKEDAIKAYIYLQTLKAK